MGKPRRLRGKTLLWIGAAALALAAALAIGFAVQTLSLLDVHKLTSLNQSTVVYDRNDARSAVLSGVENRRPVALAQVPEKVREAFVATEDARFYRHRGVDFYRIGGALWRNIRSGGYSQGASTITQQLIKLTHLTNAKTIKRKAQEALLALRLETVMGKDEILEAYLNAVYFGAGAYGIEAASRTYFGIGAESLTLPQGALLAAVIKSPSRYAPHLHPENALERRNLVLDLMAEEGYISGDEKAAAQSAPLEILPRDESAVQYAWYVQQAADEAARILGVDYEALLSGGYALYTGLDPDMQKNAEQLFQNKGAFPADAADGVPVQAALVCLDADTGLARALMGGRDYQVARGLNRASAILRQPGSAFKPVSVYASAVDRFGYLPVSVVDDTQRDFGGGYAPGNVGGNYYGQVTLREALSRSLNVATVDLLSRTGVRSAIEYAQSAGLGLDPGDANLSIALGALTKGVSPMALAGAYTPLAGGGTACAPHLIRRIEDARGETLYEYHAQPRRVMSASSARLITDMLFTAATDGTARALGALDFPVAGKTGTVGMEGGNRDAWTVAYTPKVVVSVWMGFDQPNARHILPNSVTGSGHPARLAAEFLRAGAQSANGGDFDIPDTLTRVLIDRRALDERHEAMLVSDLTPSKYTQAELFPRGASPERVSDVWRAPSRVFDMKCAWEAEGMRVWFTAVDHGALYRLYRSGEEAGAPLAELSGAPGEKLSYLDSAGGPDAKYYVVPYEKELLEEGVELAGAPSDPVGVGANATPPAARYPAVPEEAPLFS